MATTYGDSKLKIGDFAPDFELSSTSGVLIKLSDFRGRWLVLCFFPKVFSPGCTREFCSLRDGYQSIKNLNTEILGISLDNIQSQKNFKDKNLLPFECVSDLSKKTARTYQSLMLVGLVTARRTFIVNPEGRLAYIFEKVNVKEHAQELVQKLKELQKST